MTLDYKLTILVLSRRRADVLQGLTFACGGRGVAGAHIPVCYQRSGHRHRGGRPAYERLLGGEDYIEHIARSALAAGVGTSGPVGEATAHLFARELLAHAVGWIERTFPFGGATDPS